MRADLWNEERTLALKFWRSEGDSARAIAKRLGGVSRSAVLGKIFRLRLAAAAAAAKAASAAAGNAAPDIAAPAARPRRPRGNSLLELTNHSCRWPHGCPGTRSFFFCGEPGADLERGMPYCARHARRAFRSGASLASKTTTTAAAAGGDRKAQIVKTRRRRAASPGSQAAAVPTRDGEQKFYGRSVVR